jgi:hypothetical protein
MILAVVLLMAGTLLTTTAVTTMVPAAYAGGDNDDGNKQKAEDDSSAGIADCDRNDVEEARFLCIAIAANGVEIEPPEEEPPEETATLSVCKFEGSNILTAEEFLFTVTGNNPSPAQFFAIPFPNCVEVTIDPGEYEVSEVNTGPRGNDFNTNVEGNCVQDPPGASSHRATGEIQAGVTQVCTFENFVE